MILDLPFVLSSMNDRFVAMIRCIPIFALGRFLPDSICQIKSRFIQVTHVQKR
jgi:hypothetical protein